MKVQVERKVEGIGKVEVEGKWIAEEEQEGIAKGKSRGDSSSVK